MNYAKFLAGTSEAPASKSSYWLGLLWSLDEEREGGTHL